MITGQQAFSGPSTAVVFDGILNRMPPPSASSRRTFRRDGADRQQGAPEGSRTAVSVGGGDARRPRGRAPGRPSDERPPMSGASIPASGGSVPRAAAEPLVLAAAAAAVRRALSRRRSRSPTPRGGRRHAGVVAVGQRPGFAGSRSSGRSSSRSTSRCGGHRRRSPIRPEGSAGPLGPGQSRPARAERFDRSGHGPAQQSLVQTSGLRVNQASADRRRRHQPRNTGAGRLARGRARERFARTAAPPPCSPSPRPSTTTACSTRRLPTSVRSPPNTRRLPRRPPPTC